MFGFIVGLIGLLVGAVGIYGAIAISVAAVAIIAANWDTWGKRLVMVVGAVIAVCTAIYLSVALFTNALVYTQLDIVYNIILLVGSTLVGWEVLLEWIEDIALFLIDLFTKVGEAVLDAVAKVVSSNPLLAIGLFAGAAYLLSSSDNGSSAPGTVSLEVKNGEPITGTV